MYLCAEKLRCLKNRATICSARLLSIARQVGAYLWHEGPAGGLQWDSMSRGADVTTEASPTPLLLAFADTRHVVHKKSFRLHTLGFQTHGTYC